MQEPTKENALNSLAEYFNWDIDSEQILEISKVMDEYAQDYHEFKQMHDQ